MNTKNIAIIGGGAAGFFGAINLAKNSSTNITIFELSGKCLTKVKISGGGRCNVTHHEFNIPRFCENYPRGKKELKSPFNSFQAKDTVNWFKEQGINLKVESDGRMFPVSNSSQSIIDCFLRLTHEYKIKIEKKTRITNIQREEKHFNLFSYDRNIGKFDAILIASGSHPSGYELAKDLGHSITDLAPSLFSFKINHPILKDHAGISFSQPIIKLKVGNKKFEQIAPILITHWGLSGPGILKLSAYAAREMKLESYQANLTLNFLGKSQDETRELLMELTEEKSQLKNISPEGIPKKFWESLLLFLTIEGTRPWNEISKKDINKIIESLCNFSLTINGQNRFKEEFVECGGVNLKEINLKTMESRLCSNLYFAGEILDIDGVTGGFNFQNAWTTSYIVSQSIRSKI